MSANPERGLHRRCGSWVLALAATALPGLAWAQQTATATGSCGVAINASGQAQVTVTNNCDTKTAAAVQKLVNQNARQDRQIKELNGSLRSMTGDLDALRRDVQGLTAAVTTVQEAAARPSATPEDRRAEALLASGDASAAADLLGRKARSGGQEAPTLFRQQAALLAVTDTRAALAALDRALLLEPGDFDTLWRAGNLAFETGQLDKAAAYYDRMRETAASQSKQRPGVAAAGRVAMAFMKTGDIKLARGDTAGALSHYGAGTNIALGHAKTQTNNADLLRTLAYGLRQTGAAQRAVPDGKAAIKAYQDSLAVARLLVGLDERNADAWVDLLATHLSLADLQNIYGDRTAAQENLKAASMISQALLKIDGDNVNWLNAASACHTGQAALDLDRGDLPAALRNFQAGLAISQRLVLNDPGSHIWKRNVLTAQLGIGDVLLAQRKLDEALRSYQAALSGARVIARANSGSRQAVTDQVIALVKSADVLEKQGEVEAALQHLQTALPLAQSVGQTVTEWRTLEVALRLQLGTAYGVVGDQQRSKGDAAAALQSYLASRAQFQALSNPQGREAQRLLSLAELAWKIGTLEGTAMPLPERRAVMKQGLDLLMDLQRQGQLPAAQAGNPELFRQALARLN